MLGRLDKYQTQSQLKAHVLDEGVIQQKNLQTTGLPIFTVSLGILLRRPGMVKNERFSDLTTILFSFIFSFYLLSLGPVNHLLFNLLFYPN